jgi:hypothetical protein
MIVLMGVQHAPDASTATTTSSPARNLPNAVNSMENAPVHLDLGATTVPNRSAARWQMASGDRHERPNIATAMMAGKASTATFVAPIRPAMP